MSTATSTKFEGLISGFKSGFDNLYKFDFSLSNPAFWLCIIVLYLFLRRSWKAKNAVTFLLLIACILLLTTKFEVSIAQAMSASGEKLETGIVRLFSLALVGILFMLFAFLK